nr:hypothetical protein CFP56_24606 [Quercus suber]
MPYPLHLSRLTLSKSPAHSAGESDYDSDALLADDERPPPVPRKDSPAHERPRRNRAKLTKTAKSRGDSCTSSSMRNSAASQSSTQITSYFGFFGRRQPTQLPRLDTTVIDSPPVKKSPVFRDSTRIQYNQTKFQAEFTPLSEPPSRSISYNPSPQTEDVVSPGTYVYNGEQMDVHGSGHYKHHPLVKNNSADVLWHGGYRSRMEHKDSVSIVPEEDERTARTSAQGLRSVGGQGAERPKTKSITGRMDSGTLIVDELDKVLAQQAQVTAGATTGNDVSTDVPRSKDTPIGLTMPRRRLPRSDTYYDLTPPPPLPIGLIRSGSLPLLPMAGRVQLTRSTSTTSCYDGTALELIVPHCDSPDGCDSRTRTTSHPQPLRSHPPDQPTPIFPCSRDRPRPDEITFNTGIFTLSSTLQPLHSSDASTPSPHDPPRHPSCRVASPGPLSVDYPFYNPTKPPHAQFTSTHTFNSRSSDSWGDAKRWCCCCCGGLTIVEQGVCANLRCAHERCHAPACMGVA